MLWWISIKVLLMSNRYHRKVEPIQGQLSSSFGLIFTKHCYIFMPKTKLKQSSNLNLIIMIPLLHEMTLKWSKSIIASGILLWIWYASISLNGAKYYYFLNEFSLTMQFYTWIRPQVLRWANCYCCHLCTQFRTMIKSLFWKNIFMHLDRYPCTTFLCLDNSFLQK